MKIREEGGEREIKYSSLFLASMMMARLVQILMNVASSI